jgi:YD repeat-containing protein
MIRSTLFKVALLLSVQSIFLPAQLFAQLPSSVTDQVGKLMPRPVPLSPNAAALGKYGDYEVNLFNGLPDISIPLFEVKSGSISVPITLSYHASGIKPKDAASWVGLSWSIVAGGQITRQQKGLQDEQYYYANPAPATLNSCSDYYYIQDLARGTNDQDPDLFSYSYPARSGKFILGRVVQGQPRQHLLIPYEPIQLVEEFASSAFKKFEITDENGMRYRFGKNASGTLQAQETSGNITTAWNLMDIENLNSTDKVNFTYQSLGTAVNTDVSQSITVTDMCNLAKEPEASTTCPTNSSVIKISSNSTNIYQLGLDEILFKEGKVKFVLGPKRLAGQTGLNSLDRIEVYKKIKGSYILIKTIKFNYSYYTTCSGCSSKIELKLDGIQILDNASLPVQQYKFSYFTNHFSYYNESQYARDHWGFYNGATSNSNLIPKVTIQYQELISSTTGNITVGDADRNTNPTYMKEGVLQRIDYPTGGYTIFDFETHQYLEDGATKYAGGLRVKSIASSDGSNALPVVKTYKYGTGENSYGEKNFFLSPSFYFVEQRYRYAQVSPTATLQYRIRNYFSNSGMSLDLPDGSPVVYPFVTEYYGDPTNNIGKITYEFLYTGNGWQVVPGSNKNYNDMNFWRRGKLRFKSTYDINGNLLSKTEIQYGTFQYQSAKLVGYGAATSIVQEGSVGAAGPLPFFASCQVSPGNYVETIENLFAPYTQSTGALREISTIETTYKNGDITNYLTTQSTKQYHSSYLQVTETKTTRSNNAEEVVLKTKYPFDYPVVSTPAGNPIGATDFIIPFANNNIRSIPIEQFSILRNKIDGSNARVVSGKVTTYKINSANSAYIVPDKIFLLENNAAIPESTFTGTQRGNSIMADPHYKARVSFTSYDADGNIKEANKSSESPVAYLWSYNNALPVAEATNTVVKNIYCNSFEEAVTSFIAEGKTGYQSSSVSGFTTSLTGLDPGSYNFSYYMKQGSIWTLQQSTVTVPTGGSYTLTTLPGQVDDIRFHPVNARMTTYTYDPLWGMTSSTDPNNKTTYYKYDSFGRLEVIKDNDLNVVKKFKYHYNNGSN